MSTSTATTNPTSLWRTAFLEIKTFTKEKAVWIIGLAVLTAALQFWAIKQMPSADIFVQLKSNPDLLKQHPELTPPPSGNGFLLVLLPMIAMIFAYYVFPLGYLQMAAKNSPPQPSSGAFFYWLWKVFLKLLAVEGLLILGMLVIGIVLGIASVVLKVLHAPSIVFVALCVPAIVFCFSFCLHLFIRFSLVTPLAILKKEPVLKTSRELTKGRTWRIFGNWFVLGGPLLLPIIILSFITNPVSATMLLDLHISSPLFAFVEGVQGIFSSLLIVVNAVYPCVVLRTLLREHKVVSVSAIQ